MRRERREVEQWESGTHPRGDDGNQGARGGRAVQHMKRRARAHHLGDLCVGDGRALAHIESDERARMRNDLSHGAVANERARAQVQVFQKRAPLDHRGDRGVEQMRAHGKIEREEVCARAGERANVIDGGARAE